MSEQQALKGKVLQLIEGMPMKASTSDGIAILVQLQHDLAAEQRRGCAECQIDKQS